MRPAYVNAKLHSPVPALLLVIAMAVIVAGIVMPVSAGKTNGTDSPPASVVQDTVNPVSTISPRYCFAQPGVVVLLILL